MLTSCRICIEIWYVLKFDTHGWCTIILCHRSLSSIQSEDLRNFDYGGNAQSVTNLITSQLNNTFSGVSVSQLWILKNATVYSINNSILHYIHLVCVFIICDLLYCVLVLVCIGGDVESCLYRERSVLIWTALVFPALLRSLSMVESQLWTFVDRQTTVSHSIHACMWQWYCTLWILVDK